jgi:hypothetical protein
MKMKTILALATLVISSSAFSAEYVQTLSCKGEIFGEKIPFSLFLDGNNFCSPAKEGKGLILLSGEGPSAILDASVVYSDEAASRGYTVKTLLKDGDGNFSVTVSNAYPTKQDVVITSVNEDGVITTTTASCKAEIHYEMECGK